MRKMLGNLNLEMEELAEVKQAYEKDDLEAACTSLLDYYKHAQTARAYRISLPEVSNQTTTLADSILQNIFTFQQVTDQVPHLTSGHLNWDYTGPEDDIEWAWALNRHYPIRTLFSSYLATGNPKYAEYIDVFIKDWILESSPYPGVKSSTAMWRGLEVSFREKAWAKIFFAFINSDYLSPATQLLILSSLPDHAHYARNFHGSNNWLTMEMTGLATVATAWPEFKESKDWFAYTLTQMTESLKEQVYADGAQTELSAHYHKVALNNFHLYYRICQQANIELPSYFTQQIESMWDYLAYIMRPDGRALLNNDSDLDYNKEKIIDAAKEYNRKDWLYIASNGESGNKPETEPSRVFPWAGHLISRSGYDADAHWSFFDMGPWGSGHQHNDKLHISLSAYGRDLLVDAGRFAYKGEVAKKFRPYAKGSQGHNVVLIDGKGQNPGPKLTEAPVAQNQYMITDVFDFAISSFDDFKGLEGKNKHTRSFMYVRGEFWIVVDQIETDQPRKIETLWHWHPGSEVQIQGKNIVSSKNEKGNLQIIPVGKTKWDLGLVKGQETPEVQGWYSVEYNKFTPNTASIYSTTIKENSIFVWVLFPSEKEPLKVKSKVIAKDTDSITVRVKSDEKEIWEYKVPLKEVE